MDSSEFCWILYDFFISQKVLLDSHQFFGFLDFFDKLFFRILSNFSWISFIAWAPEGREGRNQAGPKPARRAANEKYGHEGPLVYYILEKHALWGYQIWYWEVTSWWPLGDHLGKSCGKSRGNLGEILGESPVNDYNIWGILSTMDSNPRCYMHLWCRLCEFNGNHLVFKRGGYFWHLLIIQTKSSCM